MIQRGDKVEWFGADFPGALTEETIDGVRIVRAGKQWTVHWAAYRRYRGSLAKDFDIVVDEVNTIPFFTPIWADVPVIMLIHQLAREVWWFESRFPLNALGFLAEPIYLRAYRQVPVLTVSESTRSDLLRLDFKGSITIIPEGLELIADACVRKSAEPTFLYVGRIAPSKRIEHMVEAIALFRQTGGSGTLWLVGPGDPHYQQSLIKLATRLNVANSVVFKGRVSSSEKHRMMAEASALLMTSVREGWGLVVTEANACGTPAIVYDVPGLRDSVRHESTGLVVPPRPEHLSAAMSRLVNDPALYSRLVAECRLWSSTFSFDVSARMVGQALDRTLAHLGPRPETDLPRKC